MLTFKQFVANNSHKHKMLKELLALCEHETYRRILGSSSSYRQDAGNTNSKTQRHAHVYARLHGDGSELYSVNFDGSGHDGSSGTTISTAHAEYFRSIGYNINPDNVLESLFAAQLEPKTCCIVLLEDE